MKCFVIMPFGNHEIDAANATRLESIYTRWIKPAVESISVPGRQEEKISCHRGDKTFRPGEIISHVIENLISAEIMIADLSGKNPNVFYELGVRHAVRSNCILIADNLNDVPFDLRALRTIIYQYEPDGMLMLQDALKGAIAEILQDLNTIDNPVRRFIYQRDLETTVRESSSPESNLVKTVLSEMASLRSEFSEQSNEMRQILKLITSSSDERKTNQPESEISLSSFEGVWRDRASLSTFYVRIIEGELRAPYSYGGFQRLIGHLTNYKLIGETLFGRFEWFDSQISGYIFLRVESDDQIKGGWWYKEDVPQEIIKNISKVTERLPKMNKLSLERSRTSSPCPAYIEKYFTN